MLKHLSWLNATKIGCSPMPKLWLLELPIINVRKRSLIQINWLTYAKGVAHCNIGKVKKIVLPNALLGEKYVLIVKIKITLQLYVVKEMTQSIQLLHTWHVNLKLKATLLPPPTTLRRSLFLFNLYYHIKTYLLSTSKSSQQHMFSRHWTYLTAALITVRLNTMSKKGYSCKRLHSFVQTMVTNVFHN